MDDTSPETMSLVEPLSAGILREDQVIEIPQVTYRHTGFPEGDLTALVDADGVQVRVATIDGDTTIRVPAKHLHAIAELLTHIRDDQ